MSDYTQGGWAKLDCEAAKRLAEVAAGFPKARMEQYLKLLLILYSSTSRDGTISIGRKTLAERAEVSEDQARYFIEKLENENILLNLGTVKTRGGSFIKRQFAWLSSQENGGWGKNSPEGRGKSQEKVPSGRGKSPSEIPHIRYTEISDREGGALDAAPPLRESNTNSVPNSEYTETDNLFPWMTPPPLE